ncbi:MAG: hypothetical protein ACLFT0_20820 [Spirulinaceae cyanobacterium]
MSPQFSEDNDRRLVEFLRQNAPVPPPVDPNLESRLLQQVEHHPRWRSRSSPQYGLIPGAIAAGLLLGIGGYHLLNPQPQLAQNPQQIEELEAFVLDNWGYTIGSTTDATATNSLSNSWLLLADPQASTPVYSQ